MIQTKPYEFMVKYTPQRDWIEGRGIMIAFAFFLGGIAGGLYLASLFFNSLLGMLIAWLAAGVMGLVDMAHLSKPTRFWRMILKPQTSWISRGFIFIWLFLGFAAIQMALTYWLPATGVETAFKVLAGIVAFGVAAYSGFVVGYVGAIRIWSSAVVPILFVVAGLTGGMALLLLASQGESADRIIAVADALLIALIVYAVSLAIYLWITTYESHVARDSAMLLLRGNIAPVFWIGVVLLGIVAPIAVIAPFVLTQEVQVAAFIISAICIIIGGVALRYVILKAGVYAPLLPVD